jgi:NAD+ kinase
MRIALHGKPFDDSQTLAIKTVLQQFADHGVELILSAFFANILTEAGIDHNYPVYKEGDNLGDNDFMFTLGGDGTILDAVTHIGSSQLPIVGVNIGRLGFLATVRLDELDQALQSIKEQKYFLDKRSLLRMDDPNGIFRGSPFALNDFTILKSGSSSMITVHTYVDDAFLNSYWADGLIISTPTGSTGYSLSCGGPLVIPNSHNFIINPVSPHNLNVRPMVVADDSELRFEVDTRDENVLVTLDSRSVTVPADTKFTVRKEEFYACLVKFEGYHPFETLRQKLYWGQDARN